MPTFLIGFQCGAGQVSSMCLIVDYYLELSLTQLFGCMQMFPNLRQNLAYILTMLYA